MTGLTENNCELIFYARKFAVASLASAYALTAGFNAGAWQGDVSSNENEITAPVAPAETVAESSVLPSTLVNYIHIQNYLQPDWAQDDIASPLLPLARTEGLDEHERFFLGQLSFMAFEGDKAYELFAEFIDRDDWYGYLARLRHEIMNARFYQDFERLENTVKPVRKKYEYKSEFADIIGVGEIFLCGHWREEGKHQKAVALAREAIAKTPRDAAYRTLDLASYCYVSFKETGQENLAFELAQSIRDDLAKALGSRQDTANQHPVYDPDLFENKTEDGWYGRSKIAPYNYENYLIADMIKRIDVFLACNRDGDESACPQ